MGRYEGRPSWRETFMAVAWTMAARSTCLRRRVGAVLVIDNRLIATGYNGAPKGLPHCREVGCLRDKLGVNSGERHELCRGVHAEENCIIQAAVFGVGTQGAEIYVTHQPCSMCAKTLINAGIKAIYFADGYPDDMTQRLLSEAGIHFERIEVDR